MIEAIGELVKSPLIIGFLLILSGVFVFARSLNK